MRILLVSCFLLSTCSLTLATEYELNPQPFREKRFIFLDRVSPVQRLLQGLTAFSRISIPPAPPMTTAPPKTTAPPMTAAPPMPTAPPTVAPTTTTKAPPTTTNAPATTTDSPTDRDPIHTDYGRPIDGGFDGELDYLTQYRDNAYDLRRTSVQSSRLYQADNLSNIRDSDPPPLIRTQSYSSLPQYPAGLGVEIPLPPLKQTYKTYSSSVPYFQPATTYLPHQTVYPVPKISPSTYPTQFSYGSAPLAPSYSYNQYQSNSDHHFSFSNHLPDRAHVQTAYFGTDSGCHCKDRK